MSDANYTKLAYVEETAFGQTPAGANLKLLRLTGEDLGHKKETVVSEELRSDRQRADLIMVGAAVTGGFEFEFSQAEYQPWMLAALGAASWTTINVTATATASALAQTLVTTGAGFADVPVGGFVKVGGLAASASNGLKRVLAKSLDNNTLTLAPGSIASAEVAAAITITGKDARNGLAKKFATIERGILAPDGLEYFQAYTGNAVDEFGINVESKTIVKGSMKFMGKVGAVSPTSLNTLGGAFASNVLTVGATDASDGDLVVVGNRTYTLKTALTGAADEIKLDGTPANQARNIRQAIAADVATLGTNHGATTAHTQVGLANETADGTVEVVALRMGTASNALATTTTAATGELDWATATLTGGVAATAPIAATTDPIFNAVTNVGHIFQGDTVATERFKSINFSIKNNLRGKDAIGELGSFEIGWGTIDVTGSVSVYFKDNTFYGKLINHDYSGIAFTLTDANGKSLAFTMPWVNFAAGDPNAEGINTDIMLTTEFTAIMHPTLGVTMIINAFDS